MASHRTKLGLIGMTRSPLVKTLDNSGVEAYPLHRSLNHEPVLVLGRSGRASVRLFCVEPDWGASRCSIEDQFSHTGVIAMRERKTWQRSISALSTCGSNKAQTASASLNRPYWMSLKG